LSLQDVLELFGLSTRGEVQKEGLNPDVETYRKLALKVAGVFLGAVQLLLKPLDDDQFEVTHAPGARWRDSAYHLGYYANLAAGSVVVGSSKALLRYNGPKEGWPDYRSAVLGNLSLLRTLPGALSRNTGRGTLLKALELVEKGPEELMVQMAA
jgi:hypothetical protein